MRARIIKEFTFEAAQTLPTLPEGHKCRMMHGHSFRVEITVEGEVDPAIGWVYDHSRISRAMQPLLAQLDRVPEREDAFDALSWDAHGLPK